MTADRTRRPSGAVVLLVGLLGLGAGFAWWPEADESAPPAPPRTGSGSDPSRMTPPVPLEAGRSHVETRVLDSGDLRVTHWINSAAPIQEVRLSVPPLGEAIAPQVEPPVATRVQVAADRRPVPGPTSVDGRARDYRFGSGTSVFVTYVLTGALEPSPTLKHRVLARVTALEVGYRPRARAHTQTISGATVQTLACSPPRPDAVPVPCGSPRDDKGRRVWEVSLRGDRVRDRVMAQMDLPRPLKRPTEGA